LAVNIKHGGGNKMQATETKRVEKILPQLEAYAEAEDSRALDIALRSAKKQLTKDELSLLIDSLWYAHLVNHVPNRDGANDSCLYGVRGVLRKYAPKDY